METRGKGTTARSRIPREITILLVAVMIVSGLAIFLVIRCSQERLIENSAGKMLARNADDVVSFFFYTMEQKLPEYMEFAVQESREKIAAYILGKQLSESQRFMGEDLKELARSKPKGVDLHMIVVLSSADFPVSDPIIFASSDEGLVYGWEIPDDVAQSLEKGEP